MMVVIILIIAGLCGFCIVAADELKEWKDLSIHSWLIALLLFGGNGNNGANPMDAVGLNMLLDIAKKQASSK